MTYETWRDGGLDYFPCRYGTSRNRFRGPKRVLDGDYVAFFGGSDTFGRFIPRPFPALVEDHIGTVCVNFGWINSGADAFLHDETLMQAAGKARAVVLQVPGAQNISNRYYAVHPRRNDRFLHASDLMRRVFPDADFTEFHFTRHMLVSLAAAGRDRFGILVAELQFAWIARMSELIRRVGRPVVLLWLADHAPGQAGQVGQIGQIGQGPDDGPLGSDPLFVTDAMLADLNPAPAAIVRVVASAAARAQGGDGLVFAQVESRAARRVLGPTVHVQAAEALAPVLSDLLSSDPRANTKGPT